MSSAMYPKIQFYLVELKLVIQYITNICSVSTLPQSYFIVNDTNIFFSESNPVQLIACTGKETYLSIVARK